MDTLRKHEVFEIEVLEKLKNGNFLGALVFGGGTMLRLCFELNRYSTDLDFWFIRKIEPKAYSERLVAYLKESYEITDAQVKFFSILVEIRSPDYPNKLKIEIRKGLKKCDFQERIAFSKYSTKQVILKALTLEQMAKNKIEAALERKDIRDCFDLEFLLRQGAALDISKKEALALLELISAFKERDFKVTLGSYLELEARRYYLKNKFEYLERKLVSCGNGQTINRKPLTANR